jgi:hypothetical protein
MRDGGGELVQTDEYTTYEIPTMKIALGAIGTDSGPVATENPMPVMTVSAIAEGLDPLRTTAYKFGYNADVDNAAAEDIIDYGGDLVETLVATPAKVAVSSANAADVLYAGTLTFSAAPTDTETITIGSKVYTFQAILTNVDGNVFIGASASDCLDNLIAAINLDPAGAGSLYAAAMTANAAPTSAVAGDGDTLTLYAKSAIATTDGMGADGAWGAATTVAGTGAQKVTIYGLDADGDLQSETIDMTGITLANSVGTYSFIYRALVASAGTGGTNAGIISITDNPLTEYYAQILATNGQTLMSVYKVPTGYELYMLNIHWALGTSPPAGADVLCDLYAKPTGGAYNRKHRTALSVGGTTTMEHCFCIPLKFVAGTIIKARADTDTDNTAVAASWDAYLKDVS